MARSTSLWRVFCWKGPGGCPMGGTEAQAAGQKVSSLWKGDSCAPVTVRSVLLAKGY